MGEALSAILSVIGNALGGAQNAGNPNEGFIVALINMRTALRAFATFLDTEFSRLMGAWQYAQPNIVGGAAGLGDAAFKDAQMWTHLIRTILPNTVDWVVGDIHRTVYDPLYRDIVGLRKVQHFLMGWRGQIDHWRKVDVDPPLKRLEAFRSGFERLDAKPVAILRDWTQHPDRMAAFIKVPITRQIVGWWSSPAGQSSLYALTGLIVDESPRRWQLVEQATLDILNTTVN